MIARPDGDGLYWRLDQWLKGKGHLGLEKGILSVELTQAEMDELLPLAAAAISEEYADAKEYLAGEAQAASPSAREEGLELGGE
jgi:hypothetical protein